MMILVKIGKSQRDTEVILGMCGTCEWLVSETHDERFRRFAEYMNIVICCEKLMIRPLEY
jgi:hypothetical protein